MEAAAALAQLGRQGRDLRLTVVDWFANADQRGQADEAPLPEPPSRAVLAAAEWVIERSHSYRLLQIARSARTDKEQDDFYRQADAAFGHQAASRLGFDVAAMPEALLTRMDPPELAFQYGPQVRSGMIQILAATGMGFAEIGADALAEAFTDTGLIQGRSPIDIQRWLGRLERPVGEAEYLKELLIPRFDPVTMLRLCGGPRLQQARVVAYDLAGYGSLYLFHALLMPDTPGLAALRALIDDLGVAPWLIDIAMTIHRTEGFAICLASCLHPMYGAVHKMLVDQAAALPPIPGTDAGAQAFIAEWFGTIHTSTRELSDL